MAPVWLRIFAHCGRLGMYRGLSLIGGDNIAYVDSLVDSFLFTTYSTLRVSLYYICSL